MPGYLPEIGEKCYFMQREVVVIGIWDCFHLVKIKDLFDEHSYLVDRCTLSLRPNFTNSISLNYFGGREI
ncbi:hypothetical protein M2454_003076 [Aequitasia blattaphilus]|uniref:Uncharacterized protein n=1 Tax=Aequitasia blattaphilus TaxID=2949332 RepID=A0ABT1EAC2_9FIRM|nr:hypothetical protein [Aequitasia blattaphilus]MCP1102773.1 hypothetical protein [Aequitasia blattaphilus]MCR8615413.1 hypothetical protein [Aequitasia blattaphilus]